MTREELTAELEALVGLGEARRSAAQDPFLIGIHPSASDWMTAEEIARMSEVQALLVPFAWQDREDARERVARKRAARVAARTA